MNDNNDLQIVTCIQAGDETAFAELVEKYQRVIHGFAYHKTQDTLAAEDITQEVFLDAYLNLHTLHKPERLGAWLRSIAHHKSVDWIRRQQEVSPLVDDLPSASISETLERKEAYEHLSDVIQTLPELHRLVVILKYMEGMSNSQIADFLEVSPSVVSTRLERAREQLQERMLATLEAGFPRPDFVEPVCRQIQSCRPLIGVSLQFSEDHGPMHLCTCAFRAQSLAKRTGGVCQEYSGKGLVIWYGIDRIREDDAIRAAQTALELQKQSCLAGQFTLNIRQMLNIEGKQVDFPSMSSKLRTTNRNTQHEFHNPKSNALVACRSPHIALSIKTNDILVDSTIAWLLRDRYNFEKMQHSGRLSSVYRLKFTPPVDTPDMDILVGRDAEIARLEDAIERLLVGGPGIIRLTGEAGIGKTHLLRALHKSCERNIEVKSLIWLHGKANPGEEDHPISEAIQSHFGFESADELWKHLVSLGLEDALPYFADLLHLPFESVDKKFNALTLEQIHYRTSQYLRDWLIKLTEEAPVVWVVDDTHWLSSESSRLLQYLCRATKHFPVLFLFSRRSGYEQVAEAEHGIELEKQIAQRYPEVYQEIHLEPLSEDASRFLLYHFLGKQKLLPSESDRVLELAGGNPLYLREVAQLLIDAPETLNGIPPSIERLILAHLDLLPPVHQSLLRYASVLGSHVDVTLLQAAFPEIDALEMQEQLQGIGWLQPAQKEREPTYLVWRHDLYRESIYNSIEPNVRRQLHAEIAQQLEGCPETPPYVLTDHYDAAGNSEKAAHYACLATAMYHEQGRHLRVRRYAEMTLSHPEMLSREQHIELLWQYTDALGATGHPSEAIPYLEQALNLVSTNSQRILINIKLAGCYFDEPERGVALQEKALSLIDESTETSVIMEACQALPMPNRTPNPDLVRRVLHLVQKRRNQKAEALALCILAFAQKAAGNLNDAQSTIQHAIQIAEELEDNELLAEFEYSFARLLWDGYQAPEAVNHLHRALHLWEQEGINTCHVWPFLGAIYHELEQYEAMTESFEKALEQSNLFEDESHGITDTFAALVQGAHQGDWEQAYHYFWQMVDSMDSRPSDFFLAVEDAIGALCHGDKTNHHWTCENIPQTMARAQKLIRRLYEHGITAADNCKRLRVLHPILAAGYVEYGVKRSHEEGVALMRLFARQVWILDEHVEYWAYLTGILDYDALEAIFEDALEQVDSEEPILPNETKDRPEFFHATKPEKLILEWLRACLRERYETDDVGKHLRQMGIIPEPCWLITGTFDEHVPPEVEQEILDVVFNPALNSSNVIASETKQSPLKWRTPDDFRDGYIDCRHIFQTMDRVSAYACTAILSPKEQQVQFTIYHDDSIRVWLNGETCLEKDHCGYSLFDSILQPGHNLVLIRLTNYEDGWGFFLRVTDKDGEVLEDLTYTQPRLG